MTEAQNDWALGEQQRFFRSKNPDSVRRYWKGANVNPVFFDGRISLRPARASISPGASTSTCATSIDSASIAVFGSTNLYTINGNTSTTVGAHGLGAAPSQFGVCSDGDLLYFSSPTGNKVRWWDGASSFGTFSTTYASALCFVDNTLWGGQAGGIINSYSTAGVATAQFQFKGADGGTSSRAILKLLPYGGQVLALVVDQQGLAPAALWVGDTTGFNQVAQYDTNFTPKDMCISEGIVFIAGVQAGIGGSSLGSLQTVNYYANGNIGRLWQSKFGNGSGSVSVAAFDQGVVIADDNNGTAVYYNIGTGGVSTMFSYTVSSSPTIAAAQGQVLVTNSTTSVYGFAATTAASSGLVQSSLFDFDSTLKKIFRGVTVDWEPSVNADTGGTVDIAYQVDGVDGSYTSLQSSATSGTEYAFPANTTGSAVSIQVTLNKGSSSYGPALKRLSVRAAPQLPQYKSGTFIIDCANSTDAPRTLRDGSFHPLPGYDQVKNLITAAQSTSPISITDKLFGTYTGLVDFTDPEGFDIYEIKPNLENPEKPGSYLVRIKVRQV